MEEGKMSLIGLVQTIKKRKAIILNVVFFSVILTMIFNFLVPPTYEAETNLRVKQSKGLADSLLGGGTESASFNAKQLMSTYAEILKSRTVVQSVIEKTQSDKSKIPLYEEMTERITTQPVRDTEILKIKVQAGSPEEAQIIANTLVAAFNERLTTLARSEQKGVREFIGQRVLESRQELDMAESALEQYKRNMKVMAPADETKALSERVINIKKVISENVVNTATAQARYNISRRQLASEKPGYIADNPLIQQYKGKLADLEVELAGLSQNYGSNHPRVQALKASILETKQELGTEIKRVINMETPSINPIHQGLLLSNIQAETEMDANAAQREAIDQIMQQIDSELAALPGKEQEISRLMRDVMVAQEIYLMLAKRYEEARISEIMQPTDVQVIDVAVAPDRPIAPRKTQNIVLGVIIGFFAGLATAIFMEYTNRTIHNSQEAKRLLNLPVLGTVPDFSNEYETENQERGLIRKIKRGLTNLEQRKK